MKISLVLEMDFLSVRLFSNKKSFPDCCVEYGCKKGQFFVFILLVHIWSLDVKILNHIVVFF